MFDESKVWVFVVIIMAVIGIGYGAHYLTSVDAANLAYLESQTKLADVNEILDQRKRAWGDIEGKIAKLRELTEHNGILIKAKEVLEKRYRTVDSEIKYAVDSMKSSVAKVRENAPGTELGDLTLTDGKVLQGAKIRKLEETSFSLIHSNGIGTVALDLMPAEILSKYDMGADALLPQLEAIQESFAAKPEKGAVVSAPSVRSVPKAKMDAAPAPTVDERKVSAIKLKISTLATRMDDAMLAVTRAFEAAGRQQKFAEDTKSRGQPSTRLFAEAAAAQAAAQAQQAQITAMKEQMKKLEQELQDAQIAR